MELLFKGTDIPTYLHYNGNCTISDLTLVTLDIVKDGSTEILHVPGSNHCIIIAVIKFPLNVYIKQNVKNKWNFKKTNWMEFSKELNDCDTWGLWPY